MKNYHLSSNSSRFSGALALGLITQFVGAFTAYGSNPICDLPIGSCSSGAGCQFRQAYQLPVKTSTGGPVVVNKLPFTFVLPDDSCPGDVNMQSAPIMFTKLPLTTTQGLTLGSPDTISGTGGSASISSFNLQLSSPVNKMPQTYQGYYQGWVAVTTPDCYYPGGHVSPGQSVPNYTTASGSCVSQNSVCDTTGTGTFIPPYGIASCPAVNASCGSAAGVMTSTAPAANLCGDNSLPPVALSGSSWAWTCLGQNGGTSATCSAPQGAAACGSANGVGISIAPMANLCSNGTASSVSKTSTWNWTCTNGSTVACTAPVLACGTDSISVTHAPLVGCYASNPSTVSGLGTFSATDQSSVSSKLDSWVTAGYITSADKTTILNDLQAPTSLMTCAAIDNEDYGCNGTVGNVGMSDTRAVDITTACGGVPSQHPAGDTITVGLSCPVVPACGSANNTSTSTAPTTNLCAAGSTASSVSGSGPWNWTCSSGGTYVSCSASSGYASNTCAGGGMSINQYRYSGGVWTPVIGYPKPLVFGTTYNLMNDGVTYKYSYFCNNTAGFLLDSTVTCTDTLTVAPNYSVKCVQN